LFQADVSGVSKAETLVPSLVSAGVIGTLIYRMGRPNRYAGLTEEEFEQNAGKGSHLGAVVIGFERPLCRREADSIIEQTLRIEKDTTSVAGEPPEDIPPAPEKREKPET